MIAWRPYVYFITRVADRKDTLAKVDELLDSRLDRIEARLAEIGDNQGDKNKMVSNEERLTKMEEKLDLLISLLKKKDE